MKPKTPKKHPILYFLLETMPSRINVWKYRNVTRKYREIKARWNNVHHIILDINRFPINTRDKNDRHSMPVKYWNYNPSIKLLYASFQVLVNVYEKYDVDDIEYKKTYTGVYGMTWKEFEKLYKWWIDDRPMRDHTRPMLEDYGLSNNIWCKDENGVDNEKKPIYKTYAVAEEKFSNRERLYEIEDKEMLLSLIAYIDHLR